MAEENITKADNTEMYGQHKLRSSYSPQTHIKEKRELNFYTHTTCAS